MNNFEKHGLDEDNFGARGSLVSAFDAFRKLTPETKPRQYLVSLLTLYFAAKSKPQYVTRTEGGGKWTVAMAVVSIFLLWAELARWWRGSESHTFAVEKEVSHSMQINLDAVMLMKCGDLHINVQDAAGDLILAGSKLTKDETSWSQWVNQKGVHKLGRDSEGRVITDAGWQNLDEEGFGEEHVHDIVALGKRRAKWARTPRVRGPPDSCRVYGSLDLNKVQGDFHITARGHGYRGPGGHLDHSRMLYSLELQASKKLTYFHRIQLFSHHLRAIIWPILPLPRQPSRPHHQHCRAPLPQVPILRFRRANPIQRRIPLHVHQPVCRYGAEQSRVRVQRPWRFRQVRY